MYKHTRGGKREEPEPKKAEPESKAAAEEGDEEPGGGKTIDRVEEGGEAPKEGGDDGKALRGKMRAERETQHSAHQRERLNLHRGHEAEHRSLHDKHEEQHRKAKPEDYPRLHRDHEHELVAMRHGHMAAHHEMMRRHHEQDHTMHARHESEMAGAGMGDLGGMAEKEAA
jgi:hypothetical protein